MLERLRREGRAEIPEPPHLGTEAAQVYEGFFQLLTPAGFGGWVLPYGWVRDWLQEYGCDRDERALYRDLLRRMLSEYRRLSSADSRK